MEKLLGMTPPMGWNSWNTFTWEINEELIKQAADAFIENGLKDAGYESLGNELLELAVEQGADSRNVYSLLANAFISMSKADRLAELIEKAKQLNSLSRDGIVSMLESLQADAASTGN